MSLDLAAWKAAAKTGEAPPPERLLKQYAPDQVKSEGDGKYSFVISTGAVDRDRDTIAVDGWKLDNFRKNPVVLLNHDRMGLPIAKAETVTASAGQLKARIVFADFPLAQTVRGLVDGGFMRATSVGFSALKWAFDEERGGVNFMEQELLEFSLVTVPANPEALLDAKHAGIDLAPLKGWAVRLLDQLEPGMWLPRDVAAKALANAGDQTLDLDAIEAAKALAIAEIEKRGRTLSAANEDRIRNARGHLDEVLSSVETEDEDGKAPAAPGVVVRLAPAVPKLPITRDEVEAAVQRAARKTAQAAVNAARGRLD